MQFLEQDQIDQIELQDRTKKEHHQILVQIQSHRDLIKSNQKKLVLKKLILKKLNFMNRKSFQKTSMFNEIKVALKLIDDFSFFSFG